MDNGADRASFCEGYVVEIDGHFNSEYGSITAALSAGLKLNAITTATRCAPATCTIWRW
jgi:hypothetical protein